jgi:hypothetical protein
MGIGTGIILIAVGAILKWAVTINTSGVNWQTVGVILMIAGAAIVVLSLILWEQVGSWRPGRTTIVRDRTYTDDPRVDPS